MERDGMSFPSQIGQSLVIALWFMFLTFPILVIRVDTIEKVIDWRWMNMIYIGGGSFLLSFVWRYFMALRPKGVKAAKTGVGQASAAASVKGWMTRLREDVRINRPVVAFFGFLAVAFPFMPFASTYQINILTNALLYIVLGLGLNIVVGLAGLLHLGYVAFYAVGAYSFALLHYHFGIGFWTALPIGALLATLFGILLGFPVLRLRGDYLAIVTLGFGEITRLVLESWNSFSFGPSGIANIPRPGFFGLTLDFHETSVYIYFLMIVLCLLTIFIVNRLKNSRIGRAWVALREDEIACEAMGVNTTLAKLSAFALGSTWAGLAGVVFAAKSTFINPASFTFLESAMILAIVVLGGMGSILGVIVGALILILLPEYLRAFSEYRMLLFGAIMVLMMIFRPQGMVSNRRRVYEYQPEEGQKIGKEGRIA
ncbi:MAG: branched-chain amino acid transport system permease protein, livM [Syntrophus sp. SKADARSKE-3]|nr:branched-chain amino acid transport system permease protein, livM [Syntrophus sp. SKADARSKE-3]